MSALQTLEELFVKYQRLNQILKDNWNDGTQETFDGNYLSPIATEWSQYHSAVSDMIARVQSTVREIDADLEDLKREVSAMNGPSECSLNGDAIYGISLKRDVMSMVRHFIVPQSELNFADDSSLYMMAMKRFQTYDEYDSPHLVEPISIY
ncbi:MAG: hypothetical protein HDS02_01350 [Bacteroides sp.]|nr:hypothetical protein [Bacteroides sp.]